MTELSRLIIRLQRGIARNASYVKTIRHPQLLVKSLQELNDLIGNDKVKDSVATQVSHLIMIKRRSIENANIKEDEVMLNTVLYGPPGVGKTLIGTKLAKIWYSLGYLDGSKNIKEKKQDLSDLLKDLFKDNSGSSSNNTDDTAIFIYVMAIFVIIFILLLSMTWSFYNKFGGIWTSIVIILLILIILIVGCYAYDNINTSNNTSGSNNNTIETASCADKNCNIDTTQNNYGNSPSLNDVPSDDQIIKVVTRADFVDRYVGWTSPKTNKLLEENLGKVLFVDEAYSLINGPHDEFGMEALTALNLFLSQRPTEIIVIFGGYKDLLQTGVYSVQPGLKRRFMWQFECNGYTPEQLFEIFKMQLNKKGWAINDEKSILTLFKHNVDAFPAFGGDTERLTFFSELEHSRDFISNEKGMIINVLEPKHVQRGINKLRENEIQSDFEESNNPLANMMKMMSGSKSKNDNQKEDLDLINMMRSKSFETAYH